MFAKHPLQLTWHDILQSVRQYQRRFLATAFVVAGCTALFALMRHDNWEASQGLLIRNEAISNIDGLGKFRHVDDMKMVQETILEVAKSHQVLSRALTDVGPPNGKTTADWPTEQDIDKLRKQIRFIAPKGSEFGKTEVLYLKVKDHDRQRALDLTAALCNQLQTRFKQVLRDKAQSMVDELNNSVQLAKNNLAEASGKLGALEQRVGSDLGELRILHISPSGAGDLRTRVIFIEGEIRRLRTVARGNEELMSLLEAAEKDPSQLIAAPNSLLESQPALRRLKDGLVDTQIKSAGILGGMTMEHPQAKAALNAEAEIRRDIHNELKLAIRGLESDRRLNAGQVELLEGQLREANDRLAKVAALRTEYSNLVSEVDHCNKLLQTAETNLAEATSRQTSTQASLISRIDAPDGGLQPIGPSRAITVLFGLVGGLLSGLGVVFISMPLPIATARPARPAAKTAAASPSAQSSSLDPAPAPLHDENEEPLDSLTLKQALLRIAHGTVARN